MARSQAFLSLRFDRFDRVHQAEKTFNHGGVNVNRAFHQGVWRVSQHHQTEDLHELSALIAKDASADNAVGGGIHDNFHKSQRFAFFDGTGDGTHGEGAHLEFFSGGASFAFGNSDASELGIG